MCCGPGPVLAASSAGAARSALAAPHPDRARAIHLAEEQVWMDAHAHPGRCFLLDLPPEDPFVRLLGAPDPAGAFQALAAGGLGVATFATVGDLRVLAATETGIRAARDFAPGEAARDHRRQLEALARLAAGPERQLVRTASDLEGLGTDALGILLSCEGGDFLEGRLAGLEESYRVGARSLTLVHYRVNELGDIQTEAPVHGGLSDFGARVVQEMNRLGMLIDLAHATWAVTRDVLERSDAPVVISHSHLARGADSHPRLLSREHALAVARSGGVVAAWPAGVVLESFEAFVDEMLRMIDLLGVDHVALGTDMDANYRPVLTSYREVPDLAAALLERGLACDEVGRVLGGNLLRLYGEVLA